MQQFFQCWGCGSQVNIGQPFCQKCGQQFQYNCPSCQAFVDNRCPACPNCRTPLGWPTQQQIQPSVYQQDASYKQTQVEQKKKRINPWLLGCLIPVGIVVIIGAVAIGSSRSHEVVSTTPSQAAAPSTSTSPTQAPSATDLSKQVALEILKCRGWTYAVITNSSENLITASFDYKTYDKDKSYLGGGKLDIQNVTESLSHPFVLPRSTLGVRMGNQPWDSFEPSNIRIEGLTNPFTAIQVQNGRQWKVDVYEDIVFAEGPILGNYKTLDSKWAIESLDDNYYVVGEIKNAGQKNLHVGTDQILYQTILSNKGKVVGIFESGGNQVGTDKLPPAGERVKFKMKLGGPSAMPDSYDSYKVTPICWSMNRL